MFAAMKPADFLAMGRHKVTRKVTLGPQGDTYPWTLSHVSHPLCNLAPEDEANR